MFLAFCKVFTHEAPDVNSFVFPVQFHVHAKLPISLEDPHYQKADVYAPLASAYSSEIAQCPLAEP